MTSNCSSPRYRRFCGCCFTDEQLGHALVGQLLDAFLQLFAFMVFVDQFLEDFGREADALELHFS